MARKFLTPIDLNKLELQNATIQNLAIAPGSPVVGQIYYDTVDNKIKVWTGSLWVNVGSSQEEIEDYIDGLLQSGSGIGVTYDDAGNTLTITNTGVLSLSGTTSEVMVSASAGNVTLSLPDTINANTTGNAATATALQTARTVNISGPVSGSASFNGTSDITIAVAQGNDSITLGTHTTGNYVASVSGTANEIEVSGSGEGAAVTIGLPNDVSITGSLTVGGDLTISGSATYVNTEIVTINDNIVLLNNNEAGTPSQDAGIEVERGTSTNVSLLWNETNDQWTLTNDGTNYQSVARKVAANVGNTSSTSFAISHNMGTRDVTVNVYDNATYETVEVDVIRTDTNTVTVTFAVAPSTNAYRVVIVG